MAHLRVLELHRSAEGGWEVIDAGRTLLAATDAAAAPLVSFKPLSALFAECLEQDSQMAAAFTGS
jgi:hypothetical protein